MAFHRIEDIIEDIRQGKMAIIVDDEDRENEGDFVVAADHCSPEIINFMAMHGRGLICLTLSEARCRQLNLALMVEGTRYSHSTNFTMSIEAASGVTTGISAHDRSHTIRTAVAERASPEDLVQPGHVFPLMAHEGGVLTRAGHTEAGCDLARLADREPAAVIVEILNDDGTMARRPQLEKIADTHNLKIGTIADLIRFRTENERTVERITEANVPTEFGEFKLISYRDVIHNDFHFAMIKGDLAEDRPTLVRVHIFNPLHDLTASIRADSGWPLRNALMRVADAGEGVVVVLNNQLETDELIREMQQYRESEPAPESRSQKQSRQELRQHGLGAQILADCGVRKMRVMSQPTVYKGLSGFGLEIAEYVE